MLSKGQTVGQVYRMIGLAEQTHYSWRKEYGGTRIEQAKRLKALANENAGQKESVAELFASPCATPHALQISSRNLLRFSAI